MCREKGAAGLAGGGDQVRQGSAGRSAEFELDSQCSRRLWRVFSRLVSRPDSSFKSSSLAVYGEWVRMSRMGASDQQGGHSGVLDRGAGRRGLS